MKHILMFSCIFCSYCFSMTENSSVNQALFVYKLLHNIINNSENSKEKLNIYRQFILLYPIKFSCLHPYTSIEA